MISIKRPEQQKPVDQVQIGDRVKLSYLLKLKNLEKISGPVEDLKEQRKPANEPEKQGVSGDVSNPEGRPTQCPAGYLSDRAFYES